jgi:hypothetical protein
MQTHNRSVSTTDSQTLARDMVVAFAISSIAYVLLRSPLWSGDGIRWLNIVVAPTFPDEGGGNRHFLFPYQAWLVYHAASVLPLSPNPHDPARTSAVAIVQGWNALMAGATLALLYAWLRCLVSRPAAAVGVTVTALSNAFLLHATNMTEPMASVPPTLLGLLLVTRSGSARGARFAAGGLIGFASAFYVLAAQALLPAALIAALRGNSSPVRRSVTESLVRAAETAAASAVAFSATLSIPRLLAHPRQGILATVIGVSDAQMHGMYGRFHLRHLVGAFAGFGNAICSLPHIYGGFSQVLHLPFASVVRAFGTLVLALALLLGIAWSLYRARARLAADGCWVYAIASITWFATVYVIAFYFEAGYDKIWFFAMLPLGQLVAMTFDVTRQVSNSQQALIFVAPGLFLVLMNLVFVAIPRRFAHNYDLDGAVRLATLVEPRDMLVTPGWDAPSVYAGYALVQPLTCVRLTAEAMDTEFQGTEISHHLSSQAQRARAGGGRVYFLGLLDQSPEQWQVFYGSEMHLPYDLFDHYRQASIARNTIPSSTGPVTLFEFVGEP